MCDIKNKGITAQCHSLVVSKLRKRGFLPSLPNTSSWRDTCRQRQRYLHLHGSAGRTNTTADIDAFAKLPKKRLLASSPLSVRLSVLPSVRMQQRGSHRTNFHEIWCLRFYWKSVVNLICVWPRTVDINKADDQLDATVPIYWSSNQLDMFRAILCPSSGAQDCDLQHVV